MRRWRSGQSQQTVNLSDLSYGGSNPPRRTKYQNPSMSWVLLYFAAGEDSKGRRYFDSPAGEEKYHTTRTGHVMTETPPRRTK
jgi:hypothetical protein